MYGGHMMAQLDRFSSMLFNIQTYYFWPALFILLFCFQLMF